MNKSILFSFVAAACMTSMPALAATKHVKHTPKATASVKSIQYQVNKAQSIVDQNSATSVVPSFNWTDRISVGGQANFDAYWGSRTPVGTLAPFPNPFGGTAGSNSNSTDINVNNLNLFVDGKISPWLKAHINLVYLGDINRGYYAFAGKDKLDTRISPSSFDVDEVYVDLGDFSRSPFYARLGKQYPGFGDYERYPIITPLTQILSETRATAATVGAVTNMGFYFNLSGFNGGTTANNKTQNNIENFTAKFGYFGIIHDLFAQDAHYNVDISWINNMYDTDYIAPIYPLLGFTYPDKTGGISVHADMDIGAFCFWGNYVTALKDLKINGTTVNAKGTLWAVDLNAGYKFKTMGRDSKITASYQFSGNGDDFLNTIPFEVVFPLPEHRAQLGYDVNVWRFVDLGAAWAHDWSYKSAVRNKRRQGDEVIGRLAVNF